MAIPTDIRQKTYENSAITKYNFKRYQDLIGKCSDISLYGIMFGRGSKNVLYDLDGNSCIDLFSGAASSIFGSDCEEIIDAYSRSCRNLAHVCSPYAPSVEMVELADTLCRLTPGNFPKKAVFGLSGSDAVDGAIKMAIKFTGRQGVVSFHASYHGSVGNALAATQWGNLKEGICANGCESSFVFPRSEREASKLLQALSDFTRRTRPAAFLLEPIQGDAGTIIPPQIFLQELFHISRECGAVFVCDEVQTGFGRTGEWWGINHFKIVPDLIAMGKGMSAGVAPISAIVGKREVVDSLGKAQHIFTYGGHGPSCAAALQVIRRIQREDLLDSVQAKGEYLLRRLREVRSNYIVEARGRGLMLGVETKCDPAPVAPLVGLACLDRGFYVGYTGESNETLRLIPPLTIEYPEIDAFVEALQDVFSMLEESETHALLRERALKRCCGLGNS